MKYLKFMSVDVEVLIAQRSIDMIEAVGDTMTVWLHGRQERRYDSVCCLIWVEDGIPDYPELTLRDSLDIDSCEDI